MTGDQRAAGDVAGKVTPDPEHPGHCRSCIKYCGWCYRPAQPAGSS
jgi:hypothetical protein